MLLSLAAARTNLVRTLLFLTLALSLTRQSLAQAHPLITAPVDETKLVQLSGSVSARLAKATDSGATDPNQPSGRLMLVLRRSADQESALQAFLQQAHEKSSPTFHKWLTPTVFAQRFGADAADVEQLTAWLQSHGLTVARKSVGNNTVEFSGTIGQVNETFHTSVHTYTVNGETHHANATAAQIPAAFYDLVSGVTQLNDFKPTPEYKLRGEAAYTPKTHTGVPQWTYPDGAASPPVYFLAPEDVATQYDVKPAYAAGLNGAGQTIGIINDSNIDIGLVNSYRKLFGLPVNPPLVVVDGNDPGINGDSIEAYLDVENAGALAPSATIKLYIAGSFGLFGDGGLPFAMQRAVNDDDASVLSLSFGECEEDGTANNQFINSVWEQAAAQGQTVLVATGDSGSFGCYGLGVNGLASTPWTVGVGGTDIYLTDYASGGASIASFWSDTNDASYGSLQKTFPEQPWNGSQFGLNSTTYDPAVDQPTNQVGGGGGASSCAVGGALSPTTGLPICTSGYPKPSWQAGAGVPADGVRDLPDVALFASNGVNGIIWPVCARAGDCTELDPATGSTYLTAVGGTSASTPAMAAFMSLIDQKYGPQGQADYVLYPLAQQYPTVFNSLAIGSNNEPCSQYDVGYEFGCATDKNGDGFYSLQGYYATAGYDQASGLGSVDVNQLITNWSKISFKSTGINLTLAPTTIVHGQAIQAEVTVTGAGTASGGVSLVTTAPLANNKSIAYVQLTNGSGQASLSNLPGGTYMVAADYGGDGVNAPSTSQPVPVTVSPEASTLLFSPTYQSPVTYQVTPITAGSVVPYGLAFFDAQIAGSAGKIDGLPTGAVTFADGSNTLSVAPLSSSNTAEFNGSALLPGTHTIGATYSGDPGYKASTAAPVTFTVSKTASYTVVFQDLTATFNPDGSIGYFAGQTANLTVLVGLNFGFGGACPTGAVTVTLAPSGTPISVPLVPCEDIYGQLVSTGTVSFPNLHVGSYDLKMNYNGDSNFLASSSDQPIEVIQTTLLPSSITVVSTPTSLANLPASTIITEAATVRGNGTITPTGYVAFSIASFFGTTAELTPNGDGSAMAVFTFRASDLLAGPAQLVTTYQGDSNYSGSVAATIFESDDGTDFTFTSATPVVSIASGQTGAATITLGSENGFVGVVALSCTSPASLICTPGASTASLSSYGNATATININTVTPTMSAEMKDRELRKSNPLNEAAATTFGCLLLLLIPKRRHYGRITSILCCIVLLGAGVGCGNKTSQPITTNPTTSNAPAGRYNVVITGTSASGIVHNQLITVVVQ